MIVDIINWLVWLIDKMGYWGVFLSMFIESFFAPIPSELVLPFAGFQSSHGGMNIVLVIILAGIASSLGSLPFYLLGYWGNEVILGRFLSRYGKYLFIDPLDVERGVDFFDKYGSSVVFFGRLIPIIRTVISFPAGLTKMSFIKFFTFTLIGSTLWSAVLATAGYFLGSNWKSVEVWVKQYQNIIIFLGIAIALGYILYKTKERRKTNSV